MGTPRKPRRPYRPKLVARLPATFATTAEMHTARGLDLRTAVDAAIHDRATWDDLMSCESELIVALLLRDMAEQQPQQHQVPQDHIAELRPLLHAAAVAVAALKQQHRQAGQATCTADQREALLTLADIVDEMRRALPRALWIRAYRAAYDRPALTVRPPQQEVAA